MSEYQYYEFLAIDRPLSDADMRWLRSLSTRAEIKPTSFTNVYHWGDFKGDPRELMKRCFDAHVYLSNFGIRRFMLRLPADAREQRTMKAYRGDCGVASHPYCEGIVLDFRLNGEPGEWDDDDDDGTGWMASLAPLRAELLDGDWRSLYSAWLLNVQFDALDADVCEPPVPPGLGALSTPCETLVDFLHVDRTLLAVAAEQSPPLVATAMSESDWRLLLGDLAATEKDDLLLQVLMRDDAETRRNLRKRLRERRADAGAEPAATKNRRASGSRTVGELATEWRRREAVAQQRAAEAAARERARVAEEQARARHEQLTRIAARAAAVWDEAKSLIQSRSPKSYDQAVVWLADLRDAAALVKKSNDFNTRLRQLRMAHASKPSLIKRMDAVGLR